MKNYCGADCESCAFGSKCRGCTETCGSPFDGRCIAAEYIKTGGKAAYEEYKSSLVKEASAELVSLGLPETDTLYELVGEYVNLAYDLPGGEKVKFLSNKNIYLAAQVELGDGDICCGTVTDGTFILICSYSCNGSMPELLLYKKR